MRKFLLLAAAFMVAAPPAHSQQPLPEPLPRRGPPPGEGQRPRRHLFVSPSGEPFRGLDGLAAWFAEADADHDAALAPAEFQADAERAFRLYDSDGSGVLDGLEIQAYERERVPEITELAFAGDAPRGRGGGRRRPRGDGGGERSEARAGKRSGDGDAPFRGAGSTGAARFSLLNEPEPLLAADEDIDGKVTWAEWRRAAVRRFALLDRDHAGRLTLAGLRASAAKHRR